MKTLLLTIVSISTIFLVLSLGYNRTWFFDKPLFYWDAFLKQSAYHASLEDIRRARYGQVYMLCMTVKEDVAGMKIKDPLILFEPNGYYRDSLHSDLRMPIPAVFYYYTGLRSVWINSPGVEKANCLVRVENGKAKVEPILSSEQLQAILTRYRKFVPIL